MPDTISVQHSHRVPNDTVQAKLRRIREATATLARLIELEIPAASRERSLAQTKIDEARMWACNAATLTSDIPDPV